MLWSSVLVALAIAIVVTLMLVGLLGWRRPQAPPDEPVSLSALFFVAILFLTTWAIGVWITPYGPLVWGVPWFALLLVALLVSLLVGVAAPQSAQGGRSGSRTTEVAEVVSAVGFGIMFWALVVVLVAVALFGSWRA